MPHMRLWEVDVPAATNPTNKIALGGHIFIGKADSADAAQQAAHAAYDKALLLHQAGQEIPRGNFGDWDARGLRPDCPLDWARATAAVWRSSDGLLGIHHDL